jgi:hypothetical protein
MDLGEINWGLGHGVDSTGSGLGSLAGCCECGDEPLGYGATELVSYLSVLEGGRGPRVRPHDIVEGLFHYFLQCNHTLHFSATYIHVHLLHIISLHFILTGWNSVCQKCKLIHASTKYSSWFFCTWNRFMFHKDF